MPDQPERGGERKEFRSAPTTAEPLAPKARPGTKTGYRSDVAMKQASEIAGTPARTVMTKEYVQTVGRLAYIWGWPLVNGHNRAAAMRQLPEPGRIGDVLPAAPPGYVGMLTDYIDTNPSVL